MKAGDRVSLTRAAAETLNSFTPNKVAVDWLARSGVIHHVRRDRTGVLVLWDGRKTLDPVPMRSLVLGEAPEGRTGLRGLHKPQAAPLKPHPARVSPSSWRF